MVFVKEVSAKAINDSRREKTIEVQIKTSTGKFSASSPTGKSTGRHEKKSYMKTLEGDIKTLKDFSDYFSEDSIDNYRDLKRIEDILDGHVGANSVFALESAVLKAMAKEQGKEIWEIIGENPRKKFPRFVGNCIGGGKHSKTERKPDFQEFLLIPNSSSPKESFGMMKKAKEEAFKFLKDADKNFSGKRNDEDAWQTSLNDKEILEIMKKLNLPLGVDVASSGFYKRKKYHYKNPMFKRSEEEQFRYLSNLIHNFNIFYVEDGFDEEDFSSFAKLLKKFPKSLIVGDDLTTTDYTRLGKAIKEKSINAIIVKPNQIGSLIDVGEVCDLARKNNVKIVFSHRSGETNESILADLAFGFGADFFKSGITGKEREVKIKRLIEIEEGLK